ncbi:MAG: hypothetical protein SV186_02665 [Candidatus Nanohaloarchaea archaeon]|nr:hypothetical protein [Candidatus Nanohaloarchaea archaeon]
MNADEVFNRYDVRGDWPEEIDEEFSRRLGRAYGTYAQREAHDTVVIGHDTREHSEEAADAFAEGVRSTGASLVRVGLGTTDRVALAAEHYGGLGAMVTASHHEWSRTGFKFLYEQGYGFGNEDLGEVKQLFREEDFATGESHALDMEAEFDEEYVEAALSFLDDHGDAEGTVVLDCCNGGASRLAPEIFEELGFEVVTVNDATTGGGVDPEPDEDNRRSIKAAMEEHDAGMALGYDPDGDRVYAFHADEGGMDGNELFYLLGRLTEAETIAASIDTSDLIEELDAAVEYARVGDVFVSALGAEMDADLLGEPNGHYAVTEFCWYNSGILCSALLALHHDDLPALLDEVSAYTTERRVLHVASSEEKDDAVQDAIKYAAKNFEVVSTIDGVKFTGDGFTALVRPSGTSNKVRLIVNGTDADRVAERADGLFDAMFGDY